jgi:hypothetical protein
MNDKYNQSSGFQIIVSKACCSLNRADKASRLQLTFQVRHSYAGLVGGKDVLIARTRETLLGPPGLDALLSPASRSARWSCSTVAWKLRAATTERSITKQLRSRTFGAHPFKGYMNSSRFRRWKVSMTGSQQLYAPLSLREETLRDDRCSVKMFFTFSFHMFSANIKACMRMLFFSFLKT